MAGALLAGWFAAPVVIFSFYATQLPHYILPGFPAFAVLAGRWLVEGGRWPARLAAGLALAPALSGGVALTLAEWPGAGEMGPMLGSAGWLLLVLAAAGFCLAARPRGPAWAWALCLMPVAALSTHHLCAEARAVSATTRVMTAMQEEEVSAARPWLGWNYTEPSLVFYSGRRWEFTSKAREVGAFLEACPDGGVVALAREWTLDARFKALLSGGRLDEPSRDETAALAALLERHPLLTVRATTQGFNAARMSWVEVRLLAPAGAGRSISRAATQDDGASFEPEDRTANQ